MPGPQTYAATPDERLYGDKPRYTTHLCHRFLLFPLLAPQFRFLVNGNRTIFGEGRHWERSNVFKRLEDRRGSLDSFDYYYFVNRLVLVFHNIYLRVK